jgi:hypothetical protein
MARNLRVKLGGSIYSSTLCSDSVLISELFGAHSIFLTASAVSCAMFVCLNSERRFRIVSSQTWATLTIYDVERRKPSTLAAIKIALPQSPFGLLPVVIHALSIDCKKRVAKRTTYSSLLPNYSLSQKRRIKRQGSTRGICKNNLWTSCM